MPYELWGWPLLDPLLISVRRGRIYLCSEPQPYALPDCQIEFRHQQCLGGPADLSSTADLYTANIQAAGPCGICSKMCLCVKSACRPLLNMYNMRPRRVQPITCIVTEVIDSSLAWMYEASAGSIYHTGWC